MVIPSPLAMEPPVSLSLAFLLPPVTPRSGPLFQVAQDTALLLRPVCSPPANACLLGHVPSLAW